jgi:peptidoglycan/LPS O-acetylase OafA/YrhL
VSPPILTSLDIDVKRKFVWLDGLRGFAAAMVLTRHTPAFWGTTFFHSYLAVDLFFILSGFVIAHSYEEALATGRMSAREFILTRLVRLYPMYLFAFAFAVLVRWGTPSSHAGDELTLMSVAQGALLVPRIDGGTMFPILGVTWSLFFEIVVNVGYVVLRHRLDGRRLLVLVACSGLIAGLLAIRLHGMDYGWQGTWPRLMAGLVRSGFGIFFGVWLYRSRDGLAGLRRPGLAWVGVAAVGLVLALPSFGMADGYIDALAAWVVFPASVLMLAGSDATPATTRLLLLLGQASYPLYLLHSTVGGVISDVLPVAVRRFAPLSGVVFVVGMVVLCAAFERTVDARWRRALRSLILDNRVLAANPAIESSKN